MDNTSAKRADIGGTKPAPTVAKSTEPVRAAGGPEIAGGRPAAGPARPQFSVDEQLRHREALRETRSSNRIVIAAAVVAVLAAAVAVYLVVAA